MINSFLDRQSDRFIEIEIDKQEMENISSQL